MSSDGVDYRDPEWVASRLGLDKNTLYKFLQDGTIPAIQLGRKWLISESRLMRWLDEEANRQTQARRSVASSAERTVRRMGNFTPSARAAIRLAHSEARHYNHAYLGQEHLLLGLAADVASPAGRFLAARGADANRIRELIEARVAPGEAPVPRRLGRTPRAKKAMRLAAKEAEHRDCRHIGDEHLLLGIALCGEGLGFELLRELGVSGDEVRQAIDGVSPAADSNGEKRGGLNHT